MNPKFLVIRDQDFGMPITLSRTTDMYDSQAEADFQAEQSVRNGSRMTYVFKMDAAYVPQDSRFVQVVHVDVERSLCGTVVPELNWGGSGGED